MSYNGYKDLNRLKPLAFLDWNAFTTDYDAQGEAKGYNREQHQKGLKVGWESRYVFISSNGTWGAGGKNGGQTTSSEGIGYHSCTKWLLKGFLDSGVPIVVYRSGPNGTWIVGTEEEANAR